MVSGTAAGPGPPRRMGGARGARKGSVAPSAAVPRTQDLGPSARGDRLRPRGPGKRLRGQPFTRRTSASSCWRGWDWTRTHTHTRWGSVGFPPGASPVGHASRGKQSSVPSSGGLVGGPGFTYTSESTRARPGEEMFSLSGRSRMGCFLT